MKRIVFILAVFYSFPLPASAGEQIASKEFPTATDSRETKKGSDLSPDKTSQALTCEWDNDFTCEEWGENADLANLSWEINNNEIRIEVDQDWLDQLESGLEWGYLMAEIIAVTPVAAFRSLLLKYTRQQLIKKFGPELAGAIEILTLDRLKSLVIDYGMSRAPKIGDVLIIKGGEARVIKKEDVESSSGTGGGTAGGGGSAGGSVGSGGLPAFGGVYVPDHCMVALTGVSGDLSSTVVC